MGTEKKKIAKQKAYFIGLFTVVFLTIFNQFLIQKVLSVQQFDATVINLAGRQRMISQKIVKEAYQVIDGTFDLERLKNQVLEWDIVHEGLQKGDQILGLPILESEKIQVLFNSLSPVQSAISTAILKADSSIQLVNSFSMVLENEIIFLSKMDEIVNSFEYESGIRTRNLILLEISLAFFSLFVLLLEFKYIFKPLFEKYEQENRELEETISDLSESKGKLFKSTQRFDLSIEAINAGIWDWYIPDGTEWWSDKFYILLGYEPNEIPASYSTFLYKLVHPDDRIKVENAVKAHLEDKVSYKIEIRLKRNLGGYRWFESVGQASWDFEDNPIRMVGSIIDIDEKMQFESQILSDGQMLRIQKDELQKLSTKLSLALNTGLIGIWEWDIKTNGLEWDDQMLEIYGITREQFSDGYDSYSESVLAEDLAGIEEKLEKAIETKSRFDAEFRIKKPDGSLRYILAKADLILGVNDEPEKMIGINYDISDLKK